jgi:N-acetylmuramoyl-L-alanine amidase
MKKVFLFFLSIFAVAITNAEIRVLSDTKLGNGYFPRFVNAETIEYLAHENADYLVSTDEACLRVDNENLDLNLYRNGEKVVLKPHGDANYIWVSLSPNMEMILFNTKYGTGICDLNGKEIVNLGQNFDAPVWYGNNYVVGMDDNHDGYRNTESSIMIASIDGAIVQRLTQPDGFGMYPDVDAKSGRIVYNTEDGDIRLIQLNLTEEPIQTKLPRLVKQLDGTLLNEMQRQAKRATSTNPADYKIYINPGHGGYDSDDRQMNLYPIFINSTVNSAAGYTREQTFFESTSNLDKGLRLDTMLRALGFQTKLSRIHNTTADDRSLSGISAEASDWNADFMLSIHSNAGNPSNYILQIHSGITPGDPYGLNGYPEKVPQAVCDEARAITTIMAANQYMNEVSCWSREPRVDGDKTFARTIMGWSNGYGVLRNLKVPGTISEGMMHDYLPETYRLMNIDYKRQESFYFAKTFMEHFCQSQLPYGAIGGKINDDYQKQIFPDYRPRRDTRDVFRPINRGVVELWKDNEKIASYTTDTLYNGCYFFWNLQPGTYVVKATPKDYYPQEDTLVVENNKISYANFALSMQRATPLEVVEYSPHVELTDSQLVSVTVAIDFNWDAQEDSTTAAFSITPSVDGAVTYEEGGRRLRFTPTKRFEPDTEYTVSLSTQACHPDFNLDNHMREPFTFKFRTSNRGSLTVVQTYPVEGATDVPLRPSFISIVDGPLTTAARNNMGVLTPDGELLKPVRTSMKTDGAPEPYGYASFEVPGALKPHTQYKLVLLPQLSDVNGVLMNDTFYVSFTTGQDVEPTTTLYNPLDTLYFKADTANSFGVSYISTIRYDKKKYEGPASNKLEYNYSEVDGEALYIGNNMGDIKGNSNSTFAMHVCGNYSFNTLYAKWAVEGDIKYTKICDLDYAGWIYQEADMSALPIGVDYQFMGLRLVRQNSFLSQKGEFYVDAMRVEFEPSTSADVEQVLVPVETNCKIIENGYLNILINGVKYNAEGKVIK